MTGLLVSVRNAQEADAALRGGATLIDIKEPNRGSLGAADARHWNEVARRVNARVPVSVALGELLDADIESRINRLPAVAFAKIGLAGCLGSDDWARRWETAIRRLPANIGAVGVAYVDWQTAAAPPPQEIVERSGQLGCRAMLWDTFGKQKGHLLDHISTTALAQLIDKARQKDMLIVLAGSIHPPLLSQVMPMALDLVAVRGAVCDGPRTGSVQERLVREMTVALRQWEHESEPIYETPRPIA